MSKREELKALRNFCGPMGIILKLHKSLEESTTPCVGEKYLDDNNIFMKEQPKISRDLHLLNITLADASYVIMRKVWPYGKGNIPDDVYNDHMSYIIHTLSEYLSTKEVGDKLKERRKEFDEVEVKK